MGWFLEFTGKMIVIVVIYYAIATISGADLTSNAVIAGAAIIAVLAPMLIGIERTVDRLSEK